MWCGEALHDLLPAIDHPGMIIAVLSFCKHKKRLKEFTPSACNATGNAYDFTTSTGQGAWPMTFSATLPISSLRRPVLP